MSSPTRGPYTITCPELPHALWRIGATPTDAPGSRCERLGQNLILPRRNCAPAQSLDGIDTSRNVVKALYACVQEWQLISARYEKTPFSLSRSLSFDAALDHLRLST